MLPSTAHRPTRIDFSEANNLSLRAGRERSARFRLRMGVNQGRKGWMKRNVIRLVLAALLVFLTMLAAWLWTGSYDSEVDEGARFRIERAMVRQDQSFFWLELHLKHAGGEAHDLQRPVRLVTGNGVRHEPGDTTLAGSREQAVTDMWLKFWLEEEDLKGEITLELNEGVLRVKTRPGAAALDKKGEAVYNRATWRKSWLGF